MTISQAEMNPTFLFSNKQIVMPMHFVLPDTYMLFSQFFCFLSVPNNIKIKNNMGTSEVNMGIKCL